MTDPLRNFRPCPLPGCRWNLGHHGGLHQDPVRAAEWLTLSSSPPVTYYERAHAKEDRSA